MRSTSFTSRPAFPVGLHVLLLDSNAVSTSSTTALLEECLYSVTATASPQAALDVLLAKTSTFDVLLADVATLRFRSLSPECSSSSLLVAARGAKLPLLLMGDAPSEEDIMAGMRAGAADFMELPLSLSKLESIWQHVVPRATQIGMSGRHDLDVSDPCMDDFGDDFETYSAFPSSPPHSPLSLEGCDSADNCLSLDTSDDLAGQQQQFGDGSGSQSPGCLLRYNSHTSTGFPSDVVCPLSSELQDFQMLQTVVAVRTDAAAADPSDVLLLPTQHRRVAASSPTPSRVPAPASNSRSASTGRSVSLRSGTGERAAAAAAARNGTTSSVCHTPVSGSGVKRKSGEFSSAPPPPPPAFAAAAMPMHQEAVPVMATAVPWAVPPPVMQMPPSFMPPAVRPWPNMMPLPPGQVWGQPMNPTAVAPGITPPVYNLPPMPPPAMPWGMAHGGPAAFPAFPGGHMMPFMHNMMSAARPFMAGGFGGMMPPPMPLMAPPMHFNAPPPPQQQPAPLLAAHPPATAQALPEQAPLQQQEFVAPIAPAAGVVAAALPLELILPGCSGGGMGSDDLLGDSAELEASLHSSAMSSDEMDLFIPDFDMGGGKLRKITSTSFLPSLELLLWEDLEHEEEEQLSGCGLGGELGLGGGVFDLACDLGGDLGLEAFPEAACAKADTDAAAATDCGVGLAAGAGGGGQAAECDLLGLKLKKSLSLADLIEESLAM